MSTKESKKERLRRERLEAEKREQNAQRRDRMAKWIGAAVVGALLIVTVLVIVNIVLNFVTPGPEQLTFWVGILTLLPLGLLMLTGLYLFMLPYVTRSRAGRHTTE